MVPHLYPFRQVLTKRIPVEVGPFCDAVEKLCGLFILAHRFNVQQGSLHDVILPRSWLINLSRSLKVLNKDTSYLPRFVGDTVEFLRRLDSQRKQSNSWQEQSNSQQDQPNPQQEQPNPQQEQSNLQQEQFNPQRDQSKPQADADSQFKNHGSNIDPMYTSMYISRM